MTWPVLVASPATRNDIPLLLVETSTERMIIQTLWKFRELFFYSCTSTVLFTENDLNIVS